MLTLINKLFCNIYVSLSFISYLIGSSPSERRRQVVPIA